MTMNQKSYYGTFDDYRRKGIKPEGNMRVRRRQEDLCEDYLLAMPKEQARVIFTTMEEKGARRLSADLVKVLNESVKETTSSRSRQYAGNSGFYHAEKDLFEILAERLRQMNEEHAAWENSPGVQAAKKA